MAREWLCRICETSYVNQDDAEAHVWNEHCPDDAYLYQRCCDGELPLDEVLL